MNPRAVRFVCCLLLTACGSTAHKHDDVAVGDGGAGGASGAVSAAGAGGEEFVPCSTPANAAAASLVRLSFGELSASLSQLLGADAAAPIAAELEPPSSKNAFPPLSDASEGSVIDETRFETSDLIAQRGASYVREHFKDVTGCAPEYACVTAFIDTFAQRAFRRALTADEQSALERVVQGAEALGAPPEQGAQYGVYAVLESPHFLYRSEFGPAAAKNQTGEVRLSDDELASALSFFLTGAPPDTSLLEAATAHDLGSSEQLAPHVQRLLTSPLSQRHLQRMLSNYLGFPRLETVVVDDPDWSVGLGQSMRRELDLLLEGALWSGPLSHLLTSRTARINPALAVLYGVPFPPPSATLDDFGFADVELPEERAGLLTRAGVLTVESRSDVSSVVARGLWVTSTALCTMISTPHPDLLPTSDNLSTSATEREKSTYRTTTSPCIGCHAELDAYGLALDEFDTIGRFRSVDPQGRPIDASVALPEAAGGARVNGGAGLSRALSDRVFATCLAQRFMQYALQYAPRDAEGQRCEAERLIRAGQRSGDGSFSDLLTSVALSDAFATRRR